MSNRVIPEVFAADSGFEPTQIDVGTQGSTRACCSNGPEEPQQGVRAAASQQAGATEAPDGGPPALSQPTEVSVPWLCAPLRRAEADMSPAHTMNLLPISMIGLRPPNRAGHTMEPNVVHNLGMDVVVPAQIGPPARPPPGLPVVVGNGGAGPSARKAPPPVYVPPPVRRKAPPPVFATLPPVAK